MLALTQGLAALAAVLHVVFFAFESVLFRRPKIQERFHVAPAVAEAVRPWAFNQGFYNLFLALVCFAGLLAVHGAIPGIDASAARAMVLFPCACMVGAGVVLALTDRRMLRAAAAQTIPPLVALCLDLIASHAPTPAPAPAPTSASASTLTPAPTPTPTPPDLGGVSPVEGDFVLHDFHFSSGETLPELRIHYLTYGTAVRDAVGRTTNAVLVLHGTTGSGRQFLQPQFAQELLGPGQLLDVHKYYVILPDDVGHGLSSKPSDGLRARFPAYGYADMVAAERALVTQGLGIDHLRLLLGTSMGCMHGWMWAETWPDAMDAVMPMACLPVAIAGRNRAWRKLTVDGILRDPDYRGGNYQTEPEGALRTAAAIFFLAGSAPLEMQQRLATRDAADAAAEQASRKWIAAHDANDVLYAVRASGDYDPSPGLEKITAQVMFVNSADDFINPPELGIAEREIQRVKRGKFVLLPASTSTHGHGTHTWAALWKPYLAELMSQGGGR